MDTKETLNTLANDFVPNNEKFFTELNGHIKTLAFNVVEDSDAIEDFKDFLRNGHDPEDHILFSASYVIFDFNTVVECIDECVQDEEKRLKAFEKIKQIVYFSEEMLEKVIESQNWNL